MSKQKEAMAVVIQKKNNYLQEAGKKLMAEMDILQKEQGLVLVGEIKPIGDLGVRVLYTEGRMPKKGRFERKANYEARITKSKQEFLNLVTIKCQAVGLVLVPKITPDGARLQPFLTKEKSKEIEDGNSTSTQPDSSK